MDTIFALATAQGRAGVAVVRISGPSSHDVCARLCGEVPAARAAELKLVSDASGQPLDHALVLRFDAPASFTGEDVVEVHLHGSVAVVKAVLSTLGDMDDTRLAEPGEFTRRALENGKMDLAQVEGLADLIESETEAQRAQALKVVSGRLGERVEQWRSALIRSASLIEATIDFADEDVPVDVTPEVRALLLSVQSDLQDEIAGSHVAERIRLGFEIAIVGPPNAGKSTLLNALAGRDVAITSEVAGTTRDVIEVRMDLEGLPVTFLDTAGIRDGQDVVEQLGIDRARARADAADLRVFLTNSSDEISVGFRDGDVRRKPKGDLSGEGVSGLTGFGVSELLSEISHELKKRSSNAGLATHERHRTAMVQTDASLAQVFTMLDFGPEQYDLCAEELRTAIRALEALVGRIDVENLLDEIFSSFCLGK